MSTSPLDDARFDAFVKRIYDPARANDPHNEAIVRLMENRDRFNPDHPGAAFYYRTTVRRVQASWARKPRPSQLPRGYDRASPDPPPDTVASFEEFRERVRSALAALPERQREVILAKIAEKSVEETAGELGITVREVYALTFKARVKLREMLLGETEV
jgi:RNA polymerase sigma factor (sigma-70 family)